MGNKSSLTGYKSVPVYPEQIKPEQIYPERIKLTPIDAIPRFPPPGPAPIQVAPIKPNPIDAIPRFPAPRPDPYPLRPTYGPHRDCGCSWYWECSCKRVDCVINPYFEAEVKSAIQITSPSDVSIEFINNVIAEKHVTFHVEQNEHDAAEEEQKEERWGLHHRNVPGSPDDMV